MSSMFHMCFFVFPRPVWEKSKRSQKHIRAESRIVGVQQPQTTSIYFFIFR